MMRKFVVLLFISLLSAASAEAIRFSDTTVVVPIIGRFAGVGGTQWRTDLFISNHSSVMKTIVGRFYVTGGSVVERTWVIGEFDDLAIPDVVLNEFGLSSAGGLLVLSTGGESQFDARARIYNSGHSAGEFGQNVPGVGISLLRRQAFMYGLSGVNGNRLNVGVANPTSLSFPVHYSMQNGSGDALASGSFTIGPFQVVQVNDVFAAWGVTPQANVSVEFFTSLNEHLLYGYASEVRNDTGDAVFIFGQGPNV